MSALSRARFAEAVRRQPDHLDEALLLLAAETHPEPLDEPGLHSWLERGRAALDELAAAVPEAGRPDERLRAVLGSFGGSALDYQRLDASLLPAVLESRRGLPILLSTVWTEVARRAGIAAYGVGLPGHFVVGVGDPDADRVLVDPFDGGRLLPYDRARRYADEAGVTLRAHHLRPHDPVATVARVLGNIVAWAATPDRVRTRLWALDLTLLLPHHDLAVRGRRGETLVTLGRWAEGAAELHAYAEVVADRWPLEAERVRRIAREAHARLN